MFLCMRTSILLEKEAYLKLKKFKAKLEKKDKYVSLFKIFQHLTIDYDKLNAVLNILGDSA